MYTVRIESYEKTERVTLDNAKKLFGVDELFEYLQGYTALDVFFLEDENGQDIYPVTKKHLS